MQKDFRQPSPVIFSVIFGVIVCIIGTVFLLFEPWISAVIYAVGIALPLAVYYTSTRHIIRCNDEGFSVDTENKRKGNTHAEFKWAEVTKTAYTEHVSTSRENGTRTTPYFEAHCGEKLAFKVSRLRGFKGLIKLFNEKTPHLPFTWEPRAGISFSLGSATLSKAAYVMTPRPGAASSAAGPPPLAGRS